MELKGFDFCCDEESILVADVVNLEVLEKTQVIFFQWRS